MPSAIAFFRAAMPTAASYAIQATLWLIKIISNTVVSASQLLLSRIISAIQRKSSWIAKQLKSLAEFNSGQLRLVKFLRSLVNEIVIVSWVLIVIF
ncbi:MAG: hypothetical protein V7L29_24635 [Nostoc sp.]|uniref:hypothetical protein n=1 Tax=Nostoc sp. TaxID=1180 RepID=UPI002FFC4B42